METATLEAGEPAHDKPRRYFSAALISIPCAAAPQVVAREVWPATPPDAE